MWVFLPIADLSCVFFMGQVRSITLPLTPFITAILCRVVIVESYGHGKLLGKKSPFL